MSNAMSKKWLMIIVSMILVLAATPLFSACGGDDDDEEGDATGTTLDEVVEKEFRLGFVSPRAGAPGESDDSPFMAVDEINQAGGVKVGNTVYKLKAYWEDDMSTASGGVHAVQTLLYERDCTFLGLALMAGGQIVQPYTEEEKAIAVYWDTGDLILGPDKPYSFRIHFDTRLNPMIVLDWVRQNRPDLKKIEIIQLGMAMYQDMVPVEKKVWEEWGLDVHYTWYDWTTKDFYPVLTAALRHDPEAILITQSAGNSIIQQAKELGFEGQFILPEMVPPWYSDVLSPEEMGGLISMSPAMDSPDVLQAYKDYVPNYEERTGGPPYSSKVFTDYTVPYLAAAVIKAAGSTDTEKMKEVMETQPLTLEFPSGPMTIDFFGMEYYGVDHNWQPNQYIAVTENGKLVQKATLTALDQVKYLDLILKYGEEAGEFVPEETEEVGDIDAPARKLTADSTIGALVDNPDTYAILMKHIPESISETTPLFLTLRSLFSLAGPDRIDQSKLPLIEADLKALYGE